MEGKSLHRTGRIVVVATDGSKEALNALDFYMKYAHHASDQVIVIHCVYHRPHLHMGPINIDTVTQAMKEEDRKADEICTNVKKFIADMKVSGNISVVKITGDPGPSIIEEARKLRASAIVVGSRGLGSMRRTIMGSVSDYILHHTDVPVLIFRK